MGKDTAYSSKEKKIYQNDISILNIYAPNTKAAKFEEKKKGRMEERKEGEQTLLQLKSYIDHHTLIVGDFNTHSHQCANHSNTNQTEKC